MGKISRGIPENYHGRIFEGKLLVQLSKEETPMESRNSFNSGRNTRIPRKILRNFTSLILYYNTKTCNLKTIWKLREKIRKHCARKYFGRNPLGKSVETCERIPLFLRSPRKRIKRNSKKNKLWKISIGELRKQSLNIFRIKIINGFLCKLLKKI